MPIKWVFFDIGDVLFDEDAPHMLYFHSMLAAMRGGGVDVSWDEYHARILECVRVSPTTAIVDAARQFVPADDVWERIYHEGRTVYDAIRHPRPYGVLLDNMTDAVRVVRESFQVGIIANQHPEILQALDDYGIGDLFDVKVIDQVVGVSKPDPAIFKLAFDEAGCAPEEAIMVGDRPDNDIAPARALGMRTVRFRRGILYVHYEPHVDVEWADVEVRELCRLAPAVIDLAQR